MSTVTERMRVGATKYSGAGYVHFVSYVAGGIGLRVFSSSGEMLYTATVNTGKEPPPGHLWMKGWSENAGVPEALEKAGVIELVSRPGAYQHVGLVTAQLAKLTPAALRQMELECSGS